MLFLLMLTRTDRHTFEDLQTIRVLSFFVENVGFRTSLFETYRVEQVWVDGLS